MDNDYYKVKKQAKQSMEYKDYQLYVIDGNHDTECIAYKDGHLILRERGLQNETEELLSRACRKLFQEKDLEYVTSLSDYNNKDTFLKVYYPNHKDNISWFGKTDAQLAETEAEYPVKNILCWCSFKETDRDVSERIYDLYAKLEAAKRKAEDSNPEFMIESFLALMCNREYYMQNLYSDYNVCSFYGECEYHANKTYRDYLKEIGKAIWIPMFKEARKRYFKNMESLV